MGTLLINNPPFFIVAYVIKNSLFPIIFLNLSEWTCTITTFYFIWITPVTYTYTNICAEYVVTWYTVQWQVITCSTAENGPLPADGINLFCFARTDMLNQKRAITWILLYATIHIVRTKIYNTCIETFC